jgi:hypothetical protein
MIFFLVESGTDVSAYRSLDEALISIEPADLTVTRLFDEFGTEYDLLIVKKKVPFLRFFETTVASVEIEKNHHKRPDDLKHALQKYLSYYGRKMKPDPSLVELTAEVERYQNLA